MSRAKGPTQRYTWPRILLASLVLLTLFLGSATYRIRNRDEVLPVQVRSSERWLPYRMEDRTAKRGDQHRPKLNDTFGFERIYLLNLASRRDRRSEMQLLMSQYNMAYTLVEGVSGAKEKPSYTQAKEQRQHGRAQGHAKIWQQMLQERASSALILEDNFDMDRRIREQMERLQGRSQIITFRLTGTDCFSMQNPLPLCSTSCKTDAITPNCLPPIPGTRHYGTCFGSVNAANKPGLNTSCQTIQVNCH